MLCRTRIGRLHSIGLHKLQLQRLALPSVRLASRRPVLAVAMPSDDHTLANKPSRPGIAKDCLDFINYSWTQFHAVGEHHNRSQQIPPPPPPAQRTSCICSLCGAH